MTQRAIDCSTSLTTENAQAFKAAGVSVVCRYLGHITHGWTKAITPNEASVITNAGQQIVSVWEGDPTCADYFTHAQGAKDAREALQEAQAIGQPEGTPIYFTVDYDAQDADMQAIRNYLYGVRACIGNYKVGVYGNYRTISNVDADYYWQTCAWSEGQVSSRVGMYQCHENTTLCGIAVDISDVYKESGAWPIKEEPVMTVTQDSARKVNGVLGALWCATNDTDVQDAAHYAATALRKASGLPTYISPTRLALAKENAPSLTIWHPYVNSGKTHGPTADNSIVFGPIYNQLLEGSCTAFCSLKVRIAAWLLAGKPFVRLAENAQYYMERLLRGTVTTDSGATLAEGIQVLETNGAMLESQDNYGPQTEFTAPPNDWDAQYKLNPNNVYYIDHTDIASIKDAIARGLPVGFTSLVFAELESPEVAKTGLLPMPTKPNNPIGGHAYPGGKFDDNKRIGNEVGAFGCPNSWGSDWGEEGWFWVPYSYIQQYGMEVVALMPDNGKEPTPITADYQMGIAFEKSVVDVGEALTLTVATKNGTTPLAGQTVNSAWTTPPALQHTSPGITDATGSVQMAFTQPIAGPVTATVTWTDPSGKEQTATARAMVRAPQPITPPMPPKPPTPPTPPEDWKRSAMDWLKANKLITSDHNPDTPITWAEFGVVLRNLKGGN